MADLRERLAQLTASIAVLALLVGAIWSKSYITVQSNCRAMLRWSALVLRSCYCCCLRRSWHIRLRCLCRRVLPPKAGPPAMACIRAVSGVTEVNAPGALFLSALVCWFEIASLNFAIGVFFHSGDA